MYVVTCATSRTGSKVARLLLDAGRKVRAVVRNPERSGALRTLGAEVVAADYRDLPALTAALEGARAAYVIPPPLPVTATGHHAYRVQCTEGAAQAISMAKVPYVVSLSSFAAQHKEGTGMIKSCHTAEKILDSIAGTSVTHLRPSFFLENWAAQIPMVKKGILPSFLGPLDKPFTMVGTNDIAVTAARLMLEPREGRRVVELTGARDVSVAEIARAFGDLVGHEVKPALAPVETMAETLAGMGFSRETADNYQELFAAMMTGHVALEGAVPLERGAFGLSYTLGAMLKRATAP